MKRLFLHIGCGKTGSSALQVWLSQNSDALAAQGIFYPNPGGVLGDYEISSGNGGGLMAAAKQEQIPAFLERLREQSGKLDILLSSEALQLYTPAQLQILKETCALLEMDVHVIAVVRDVYDIVYSSYLQLVKRHGYTKSLEEFAEASSTLQQFRVVADWNACFTEMKVVHYDSHPGTLDIAILDAIGLSPGSVPRMSTKKVNRSLTINEAELLRYANLQAAKVFDLDKVPFSSLISDHFIYGRPEVKTPVYFSATAYELLSKKHGGTVSIFNRRYFAGKEILRVWNATGKHVNSEWATLGPAVKDLIEALCTAYAKISIKGKSYDSSGETTGHPIKIDDNTLGNLLRDKALELENRNLGKAETFMSAAYALKGGGELIEKKLKEYKARNKKVQPKHKA